MRKREHIPYNERLTQVKGHLYWTFWEEWPHILLTLLTLVTLVAVLYALE